MPETPLPADVEVRQLLPSGWHYILPRRELGGAKIAGYVLISMGIAALFAVIFFGDFLQFAGGWLPGLFAVAFRLPVILGGFAVLMLGIFILYGHGEIVLDDRYLRSAERAGFLRWSKRIRLEKVQSLEVVVAISSEEKTHGRPHFNRCLIRAGKLLLAIGYPREMCLALAESLRERWPQGDLKIHTTSAPAIIDMSPESIALREQSQMLVQPAQSLAEVTDTAESLTVRVPPAGVWKGSKGLMAFSIIWTAIVTAISSVMIFALLTQQNSPKWVVLLIVPFYIVGIGLFLGAINMGRREAAFVIVSDELLVIQKGIFGTKRRQWRREEVKDIAYAPSGMETNDVPVMELQIRPVTGRKFGVLAGRADDELQWLAWLLRRRFLENC